jgi:hypothetical protein
MGFCLADLEFDCWTHTFELANVDDTPWKDGVSRVLAMFVRSPRIHTVFDERLRCRKHIVALHISMERSAGYNGSNGVA